MAWRLSVRRLGDRMASGNLSGDGLVESHRLHSLVCYWSTLAMDAGCTPTYLVSPGKEIRCGYS